MFGIVFGPSVYRKISKSHHRIFSKDPFNPHSKERKIPTWLSVNPNHATALLLYPAFKIFEHKILYMTSTCFKKQHDAPCDEITFKYKKVPFLRVCILMMWSFFTFYLLLFPIAITEPTPATDATTKNIAPVDRLTFECRFLL